MPGSKGVCLILCLKAKRQSISCGPVASPGEGFFSFIKPFFSFPFFCVANLACKVSPSVHRSSYGGGSARVRGSSCAAKSR